MGDLVLPNVNLANNSTNSPLEIHRRIRASQVPNFLGYQINIACQLNIEAWEELLKDYWDKQLYTIQIPLGYKNFNISHLEMLNILVALRVWGPAWHNQAVVTILNSGATKDLTLAATARNIFMQSAKCDINLSVIHILGKNNPIADLFVTLVHYRQRKPKIGKHPVTAQVAKNPQ